MSWVLIITMTLTAPFAEFTVDGGPVELTISATNLDEEAWAQGKLYFAEQAYTDPPEGSEVLSFRAECVLQPKL